MLLWQLLKYYTSPPFFMSGCYFYPFPQTFPFTVIRQTRDCAGGWGKMGSGPGFYRRTHSILELVKISLNPCWLFLDGSNASSSVAIQSKSRPPHTGLGFQVSRALCCSYFGFLTLTWHLAVQADCFCKHWLAVPKIVVTARLDYSKLKLKMINVKRLWNDVETWWCDIICHHHSHKQVTVNSGLETKYSLKLQTVPVRVCLFVMQKRACLRLHHGPEIPVLSVSNDNILSETDGGQGWTK